MDFPFELPLLLDGACGTNLIEQGMPPGVCVEKWILDNPDIFKKLQAEFIEAGSMAVLTPTFGANRKRLEAYGYGDNVREFNLALAKLSLDVAKPHGVLVGGSVSPSSLMVKPYGNSTFDEVLTIYTEQISALKEAGVDFIMLETNISLADMRAGLLVAIENGLPCFVSMTVDTNGFTVMGVGFLPALITMQEMGACAFGLNCSTGPDLILEMIKSVSPHAKVPLIAKPNAGNPGGSGPSNSPVSDKHFAESMSDILNRGAKIVGGCCGTKPSHIKALSDIISSSVYVRPELDADDFAACSEREAYFLDNQIEYSDHIKCSYDMADDFLEVEEKGDTIALVEINNVEDADLFVENSCMARLPLAVITYDAFSLEYTLKNYQGRLILNSDSAVDKNVLESLAKKYGAILY